MHIATWRREIEGLISDFMHDHLQDCANPNSSTTENMTEDEWWEAFLSYREATGS